MAIHIKAPWHLDEAGCTPEATWIDRRGLLAGLAAMGLVGRAQAATPVPTPEAAAASYNNFYEFTTDKGRVRELAAGFTLRPWSVELGGECARKGPIDLDDLRRRFPTEGRVYRFRCVEAWSMVLPWRGFELRKLVEWAQPSAKARYLRFTSAMVQKEMPGVRAAPYLPWPYFEGLSLAEAMHPLSLIATGIYGHDLPPQHGAPLRLVVPWKYGFKSIKSLVRIDFVAERPKTFWNTLAPHEYDFAGNVNPGVAHPRWSQASERVLPGGWDRPTMLYNGYAEQVASLY